ncbi:DNA polymerase sigma-like protein [Strigomonas culicis]|nr:DNA polymerase sigma-like protein [Strigomonas culicis]|eukprot:EPY34551.1 DNA polymerase sigma-like protein [Strigomonas culicis]
MPLSRIGLEVEVYGSMRTGLLIPASDVDCVMLPKDGGDVHVPPALQRTLHAVEHSAVMTTKQRQSSFSSGIHVVANAMRRSPLFTRVSSIAHARVPIVKCVHRDTNTKVDLSFEKDGCLTSDFLCKEFQRPGNELARALIVLIKAMLSNWSLDDPSVGGLGSFPTSLLVLWFLQKKSAFFPSELQHNIAVLLVGFLRYYGNEEWDHQHMGMNYVQNLSFKKPAGPELCIINPLVPGMNCARSAKLYDGRIVPAFYEAAKTLSKYLDEEAQERAVEDVLVEYFGDSVDVVHHWADVVKGARHRKSVSQHQWDDDTLIYTGSLIDEQT